jgi:hypothetical protein
MFSQGVSETAARNEPVNFDGMGQDALELL